MSSSKKPKIGARVRFKRKNGDVAEGRIDGTDEKGNGAWVGVNTAPKGKNREVTFVRPSQLEYI